MTLLAIQYKGSQYKTKSLSIRRSRVSFIVIHSLGVNNSSKHTNCVQFFFVSQNKNIVKQLTRIKHESLFFVTNARGTGDGQGR